MTRLLGLIKKPTSRLVLFLLLGFLAFFPKTFGPRFEALGPMDLIYLYSPFKSLESLKQKSGSYILSDQMDHMIPEIGYLKEKIKQGVLPLYSDRTQNGAPFYWVIRNETKVIPLIILLFMFSVPVAITIFWIGRAFVGGYFFYRFMKNRNASDNASIFGAFVFTFSSYIIQNFGITMAYQYILIPVGLFAIDEIIDRKSKLWACLFPIISFQVLVAGYPTTSAYVGVIYAVYFLYRFIESFGLRLTPTAIKTLGVFVSLGASAILLSSLALFSTADFFSQFDWSYREGYWGSVIPKRQLISLIFPFYNGTPDESAWVREGLYVGIIPFLFVVYWFTHLRQLISQRAQAFFLILGAIVFFFAYDFFGFNAIYRYIPVFNASMPNNLIMLLPFFLTIWSVFGFDLYYKDGKSPIRATLTLFAFFGILFWFLSYNGDAFPVPSKIARDYRAKSLFVVGIMALVVWVFALLAKEKKPRLVLGLFFIFVFLDLRVHGYKWNRSIPRASFAPGSRGIDFIKGNIGDGKVFLVHKSFIANMPMFYDIPTVAGRGFYSSRSKELYRIIDHKAFPPSAPTQYIFYGDSNTHVENPIFEALSIKYLVADPEFDIGSFAEDFSVRQVELNHWFELKPDGRIDQKISMADQYQFSKVFLPYIENRSQSEIEIEVILSGERYNHRKVIQLLPGIQAASIDFKEVQIVDGEMKVELRNLKGREGIWVGGVNPGSRVKMPGELMVDGRHFEGYSIALGFKKVLPKLDLILKKFVKVYQDDIAVWENRNYVGRAWGVGICHSAARDEIYKRMKEGSVDYFSELYIDRDDGSCHGQHKKPVGKIKTGQLSENKQIFEFQVQDAFYLVVGDNFDKGWRAYIGDNEVEIFRVNTNMRAVMVPAGSTSVVFKYDPWYLKIGYLLMALGIIIPVGLITLLKGYWQKSA